MVVLLFLSCEKDTTSNPLPTHPQSCDTLTIDDDATFTTLAKAMEVVDFDSSTHWTVAIDLFHFSNGAKKLVVYNPDKPEMDFYDNPKFSIYWYRDGKLADR